MAIILLGCPIMSENAVWHRVLSRGPVVVVLCLILGQALGKGDILPADRVTLWSSAGVEGGIPQVTNVYTTLPAGATLAQINSAIASCPANQVVQLSAGRYALGGGQILMNARNGVVLRGAGPSTLLVFSGSPYQANILVQGPNTPYIPQTRPAFVADWVGGYAQGSTNIVLSTVAGISVGTIMWLDQINDNDDVGSNNSYEGCGGCGRENGTRSQQQMVRVQAINGTSVTIWPPLHMANWRSSQSPQAWSVGALSLNCGIEDLAIDGTASSPGSGYGANVAFLYTYNCWVRNITSTNEYGNNSASSHVFSWFSGHTSIRDSFFYGTRAASSMSYGVLLSLSHECLVENNIFQKVTGPVVIGAASSGNVIAYNYCTNMYYIQPPTYLMSSMTPHDAHNCMNLFEGNYGNQVRADAFHGTSSHNVVFRNRLTGWDEPSRIYQNYAVMLDTFNRYWSFVGNILGTSGKHTVYEALAGTTAGAGMSIYIAGFSTLPTKVPSDPKTVATMYRHGNYDTVNNTIMWTGTNPDRTIPASMYLTAKPSWFGNRPWPPFEPSNPGTAVPTNLPAGYRFVYGVAPASLPANQPPVASAAATPRLGLAPLLVTFSSTGSFDPEKAALTYLWSFGDGTTSTLANPTRTYSADGTYVAQLTVSDGTNSVTSEGLTIRVGNQSPIVQVNATPSAGPAPLTVSFSSAGTYDPEGSQLSYAWDFGDHGTSTAANPTHTYLASGPYYAQLTVSDSTNVVSSSLIRIAVSIPGSTLVAAYGFNEGTGGAVMDISGNGNVGTVVGATWTSSGRYATALRFNGTSDYVTVEETPSLDFNSGVTVEAWVNPTTLGGWRAVVYQANDVLALEASTPQGPPSFGGSFSLAPLYGTATLPLNTWSHLAGTYDGTTMRLYVNGALVASRIESRPFGTSSSALTIGGDPVYGQYFAGLLDDVRFYNRALSAPEIQTDVSAFLSGTGKNPTIPSGVKVLSQQ